MNVYLFSTVGCHLCEKAKVVLWPLLRQYGFNLKEIDIADDDTLVERYGTRIPVLRVDSMDVKAPNGQELNWPFTSEQLDVFFAQIKN